MSFILEALKKSEQQRQLQDKPVKKVNKRTLSLHENPSGRLLPWFVAGLLPLMLLFGWWYYAQADKSQTALPLDVQLTNPAPLSTPPQATIPVEPAPVPRALGTPKTPQTTPLQGNFFSTADRKIQTIEAHVEPLVMSQAEAQLLPEEELYPASTRLPLYAELSGELRGRMPAINMSMHFYNKEPNRRLVRINDLLLHEGDWVARDLQLAEITVDGITLDFLGKIFTLPRNRR